MDSVPYILAWWLGFFVVGNIAFVLLRPQLNWLADQGYAVAKVIGLVGLTYVAWILGNLHLVPYSTPAVWILVVLAGIAVGWYRYRQHQPWQWRRLFVVEEGMFALSLAVWSYVRSFNPRMEGVEKFMDAALLNGLLRTHYFPPLDPWYAGATVNYYYFGHLMVATIAKLTLVPVQYAFNLGLIQTFALTIIVTFSLVLTLAKSRVAAILSGFLLALSCNLDPGLNSLKQTFYPIFHFSWLKPVDNYIFFAATRLDPYTINEFPLYSFVVADLHAHTLGLPVTLAIMTCLYVVFAQPKLAWGMVIVRGLLLGATGPTNSFDLVMYAGLTGMVMLARAYVQSAHSQEAVRETVLALLAMWGLAFILYLPFYISFKVPVGGIGLDSIITSPINFILSHLYLLPGIGKAIQQHLPLLQGFDHNTFLATPLSFILINFGILLFLAIPLIYLGAVKLQGISLKMPAKVWERLTKEQWFSLILFVFALLLIVAPEFVYLKDIYSFQNPPYARANTIFKVYFQAWAVLSVVAGCGLAALRHVAWPKWVPTAFICLAGGLIGLSVVGTISAFQTQKGQTPTTLNGYNYLVKENPDQLALIQWINSHISGQPTIVEAAGESYTQRSRISSYTGLPEPIGWASHEWGWRYSATEWGVISQRMGDVQQIYTTTDPNVLRSLLTKWHIQYIVATPVETDQYHNSFDTIKQVAGKPVFEKGWYALYKAPQ